MRERKEVREDEREDEREGEEREGEERGIEKGRIEEGGIRNRVREKDDNLEVWSIQSYTGSGRLHKTETDMICN